MREPNDKKKKKKTGDKETCSVPERVRRRGYKVPR